MLGRICKQKYISKYFQCCLKFILVKIYFTNSIYWIFQFVTSIYTQLKTRLILIGFSDFVLIRFGKQNMETGERKGRNELIEIN